MWIVPQNHMKKDYKHSNTPQNEIATPLVKNKSSL